MAELGTDELLREILVELRTLNRKLGLEREGERVDVKVAGLDNEDAIPQSGPTFEAGSGEATENDLKDKQGAKGLGGTGAPHALMSGGLGDGGSSKLEGDHASVDSARDRKDEPTATPSQALRKRSLNGGVSWEPFASEDHSNADGEEVIFRFRYHWNLPSYGPANKNDFREPTPEEKKKWSELLEYNWAIPKDGRLPLRLNSHYLVSKSDNMAKDILQAVRDYSKELAIRAPTYSRFTIDDYLPPDGRRQRYFSRGPSERLSGLPDDDIRVKWNIYQYPPRDHWDVSLAPWRRFM
jgi:hypothetical protein